VQIIHKLYIYMHIYHVNLHYTLLNKYLRFTFMMEYFNYIIHYYVFAYRLSNNSIAKNDLNLDY